MPRRARPACSHSPSRPSALGAGACGEQGIQLAEDDPNYEGAKIFQQQLLGLPHARRGGHPGLGAERERRASTSTARTSTRARRRSTRSSTRSATAASRPARCRRTSSSARRRRRSPSSSRSTRAGRSSDVRRAPRTAVASAVLDLKAIRDGPGARARGARAAPRRVRRAARPRARARRAPARAAARGRGAEGAAERRLAGDRAPPRRRARTRRRRSRRCRRSRAAARRCARSSTACRPSSTRRSPRCRTRPTRRPPTRTRSCYERGEAGRAGKDHLELAGAWIDMEAGARVAGSRFAYLKGDLVLLELALVRWALELLRGKGFEPVIPPVLVREEALYGTGFLPDTEQQIYRLADDALYLTGTSEVRARVAARRGDPRRRAPAAALRRLLALLPARGGRGRARHARPVPRAPVRQGRDVLVRRARGRRATSTSGCSPTRRRSSRRSRSRTASSTSPSPTSAPRRRRSTTARPGCPASSATAS